MRLYISVLKIIIVGLEILSNGDIGVVVGYAVGS